jgi:uncharacterized protein YndB with AHSA1/START domain
VTETDSSFSETGEVALIVRRTIRAPALRVFEAWTKPEHLMKWWGPRPVRCSAAEVDLRVGGHYRIANQFPDGRLLWISGEFELVNPPHKLVYSWRVEPGAPSSSERVTVRFEPRDGATEVIVVHERIASAAVRATHEQGWIGCFDGLEAFLQAA